MSAGFATAAGDHPGVRSNSALPSSDSRLERPANPARSGSSRPPRTPHGLGLYLAHLRLGAAPDTIEVSRAGRPGIVHNGDEIVRLRVTDGTTLSPETFDLDLEFDVDTTDVRESVGPSGGVPSRPWGSLDKRLYTLIEAVDEYTCGLLDIQRRSVAIPPSIVPSGAITGPGTAQSTLGGRRSAQRHKEVIAVSTQFEFHLKAANAPDGELDADHLLAIVQSLKEIATKIGRAETDAEPVGRAPKRVQRVAKLLIGLASGSTRVLARRAGAGSGSLDFDLADEHAFDERFEALVGSIALDQRPDWVGDSLSLAAADLTAALQQAAPEVEFKVDGQARRTFKTAEVHRETWRVVAKQSAEAVAFVGRLYAVNLNTHRLQVQDDGGNQIALPKVLNDTDVGRLLGSYVAVTGAPEHDSRGRLTQIHDATINAAPDPLRGATVNDAVSLDEILQSAPGPHPNGGIDLTDDEFASFLEAARG